MRRERCSCHGLRGRQCATGGGGKFRRANSPSSIVGVRDGVTAGISESA
jgi:hypothetical protein